MSEPSDEWLEWQAGERPWRTSERGLPPDGGYVRPETVGACARAVLTLRAKLAGQEAKLLTLRAKLAGQEAKLLAAREVVEAFRGYAQIEGTTADRLPEKAAWADVVRALERYDAGGE